MAAIRYCGTLRLRITYLDRDDTYNVSISLFSVPSHGETKFPTQRGIKLSPHDCSRLARDSSEAFDRVAAAAISFCGADDAGEHVYNYAEHNEGGSAIMHRKLFGAPITVA